MIKVKQKVEIVRGTSGNKQIAQARPAQSAALAGRIPRISKLMALAIRFEGLLRTGVVSDQTELARLAQVTQPRMTQIMNLLHLAPDIQEQVIFAGEGSCPAERRLRQLAAHADWDDQRRVWPEPSAGILSSRNPRHRQDG